MSKRITATTELPKLPRGMGTYSYRGEKIRYQKSCKYKDEVTRLEVVGDTIQEVNRLMREKELAWQTSCDYHVSLSGSKMLQTLISEWLVLYKKNELKDRSYDRLEDIFRNYIEDTEI